MSANDPRTDDGRSEPGPSEDESEDGYRERSRYDELEIANGDVVIYDTVNHCAWIQSDNARTRESMA